MMSVRKLKGAIAATITVFKEDESIDEERTINHIKWLLDNGVQGLVVCGCTGESISMSIEEKKRVAELIIREFGKEVPICIGTSEYRTTNTIELSLYAQDLGADAILILPPFTMGLSKIQVYEHYKDIANNINIPIILYNNPAASGIIVEVQEMKKYFESGIIHGVKLTLDNPSQVHELKYNCGKEFSIFYGADLCALEGLLCGAEGWISGIINLIPKACRLLCDAASKGNVNDTWQCWAKILPLINLETYLDYNREPHWLSFIKSGLNAIGYDVGNPRRPILALNDEHKVKIANILSKLL